jgi:predicted HD phosphohydrolase
VIALSKVLVGRIIKRKFSFQMTWKLWRFELSAMFWLVEQSEPIKEEKRGQLLSKIEKQLNIQEYSSGVCCRQFAVVSVGHKFDQMTSNSYSMISKQCSFTPQSLLTDAQWIASPLHDEVFEIKKKSESLLVT